MKMFSVIGTVFLVGFFLAENVLSATYDFTGTWNYTISHTQIHGPCPPDEDTTGTCSITQTGDTFTLIFLTGRVCDPASMCTFYGTISDEAYSCSNGDVDEEGGIISNSIDFTAVSLTSASGPGTSSYTQPGEFQCTWCFDFTLTSAGNNPGERSPPVVTNPQANPEEIPGDGNSTTLLTVSVTDPDGDLASVVIDLSPLGGSPFQTMYDDGTNSDAAAGDGTYSIETTASPATPIALKALKVTATDQIGNTGSNVISLFVTSTITDTVQPQSTNSHTVFNGIAGQTLNITHFLVDSPAYHILEGGTSAITLTVKGPNGEIYATESMSTAVETLRIPDADAGTWTYEVSNEGTTPSSLRMLNQANQVSYQIETVTGGVGIVSGTVKDAGTSNSLTGVLLTTDTGGVALSVDGYYVMVTVAGIFTVTASSFGYQAGSEANVTLTAGQTETVDFSLTAVAIDELQLVGITTDLTSIPQTGAPVRLTANATGPNTIFYRFLYKAGYGTPAYNPRADL